MRRRKGAVEMGMWRSKPAPGTVGENLRQPLRKMRVWPGEAICSQGNQRPRAARPQRSSWKRLEGLGQEPLNLQGRFSETSTPPTKATVSLAIHTLAFCCVSHLLPP
jgi:hypothetical protein